MRKLFAAMFLSALFLVVTSPANAAHISVSVRGSGPDVVLIPGLTSSAQVWDGLAVKLEATHRLHIVQVLGFAGTPAGDNAAGEVTGPSVEEIHAYIVANHLKAPAVIGHSMGGMMAMELTIKHPEDVGRLMIVDSLPFFGVLMGADNVAGVEKQAAQLRDMMLAPAPPGYAKQEEGVIASLVKSPEGRTLALKWALDSDRSVSGRAMYEDITTDLRGALAGIAVPVTVLYAWDATSPFPKAGVDGAYQSQYATLPKKTLIRIDDSYHYIMLDQPEHFAAEVETFLK